MNSISRSVRGILILLVAVVIGTVVLSKTVKGSSATDSTIAVDAPSTTTVITLPAVTVPVRDPKTVKVLVANGSKVTGAAKRARNCLINGYNAVSPVDTKTKPLPSAIYAQAGFEPEASAIATALGADIVPGPFPASLPVTPAQAANVNIIVVVGTDLAASVKNLPCAEAPTAAAVTTTTSLGA